MSRGFDKKFIIFILNFLSGGIRNAELNPPCQLTLTCLRCPLRSAISGCHRQPSPPLGKGGLCHRQPSPPLGKGRNMMSCVCGGDIIYDEGMAENVPINYNDTLLQLFYKLIILFKFLEFCCMIKKRW